MKSKSCLTCRCLNWDNADRGYSEMTPGSDFEIGCYKSHWKFDPYETTQQEFNNMMQIAESCVDFELVKNDLT